MTRVLFEHFPGCAPLKPCLSCQVATYLRGVLKTGQYNHLLRMIHPPPEVAEEDKIPLTASIEELHLSFRSHNALKALRVRTIADLLPKTKEELLRQPNFGAHSLDEVENVLEKHGRRLGEPLNPTLRDFYPEKGGKTSS